MANQLLCQKYILKLNSSRLRKARWKLSLPLEEAMKNKNDLVALGSSQGWHIINFAKIKFQENKNMTYCDCQ